MKRIILLLIGAVFAMMVHGQGFSIIAGDTTGLSVHHTFNPAVHVERIGPGEPVEYNVDVNLDGYDDIIFSCGNSYAAMGYASNYIVVRGLDSNSVGYSRVDSTYCVNGFKPFYFTKLFSMNDTVADQQNFTATESLIDKELWFKGDTCSMWLENTGSKYIVVRLNSHGASGLAWIGLELFAKSVNGFSADIKETGFKSILSSIPENGRQDVVVCPNPSDGMVRIILPGLNGSRTAFVYDLSGRTILSTRLAEKTTEFMLDQGVYILKISENGHIIKFEKLIILK